MRLAFMHGCTCTTHNCTALKRHNYGPCLCLQASLRDVTKKLQDLTDARAHDRKQVGVLVWAMLSQPRCAPATGTLHTLGATVFAAGCTGGEDVTYDSKQEVQKPNAASMLSYCP